MPYKDPEKRRQYHRTYKRKQGLTNPLSPDEWRSLQRAAMRQGRGTWDLVRRLAALWNVPEFH